MSSPSPLAEDLARRIEALSNYDEFLSTAGHYAFVDASLGLAREERELLGDAVARAFARVTALTAIVDELDTLISAILLANRADEDPELWIEGTVVDNHSEVGLGISMGVSKYTGTECCRLLLTMTPVEQARLYPAISIGPNGTRVRFFRPYVKEVYVTVEYHPAFVQVHRDGEWRSTG